jgi:selenocysteine-specific elongation factor
MLAGAGGIDLVMLIVAADESVMPQTREHFHICRLLHVPAGVVVLTKADAADPEMLELARMEVRELVAGSFLEHAPVAVVSSRTGEGLDALRDVLISLASGFHERPGDGAARLPIDRVFSMKGFGTVVTGTLVSGRIQEDDELSLLPQDLTVRARGLQVHGRREGAAAAGRRVAVNAGGVERAAVTRGDTLCTPGAFKATRRIDAVIDVLDDAPGLRHGARVRFHQGTTEVLGRVALAAERGDASDAASTRRESELAPGSSAYARIRFEGPVVLTRGDRFIIRAYSPPVTVGGGIVLDPDPPRSTIRSAAARARFQQLDLRGDQGARQESAVLAFIAERGAAGLSIPTLVSRGGLTPRDAAALEQRMIREGRAVRAGSVLVSPSVVADLSARLLAALAAHHKSQPLSEGMPREEARERLFRGAAAAVFEHVLATLAGAGRIVARDGLALVGHQLSLSPEEARAREAIERIFRDAGLAPPDVACVHEAAGLPAAIVDRITALLIRQKTLVKVEVLVFHSEALARLKEEVKAMKPPAGGEARVDVAGFKARYGVTRKYAIPLLGYLDRERITRRVGDARVVL